MNRFEPSSQFSQGSNTMSTSTKSPIRTLAAAAALALLVTCASPPEDTEAPNTDEQAWAEETENVTHDVGEDAGGRDPTQLVFDTVEEAFAALVKACRDNDDNAMLDLLGHSFRDIAIREDRAESRQDRKAFADAAQARLRFERESEDTVVALLGGDAWPCPIPLARTEGGWYFDTAAGADEILNRRIGEHELETIAALRSLVSIQSRYAAVDRDDDGVLEYAQQFRSSDGARDGLYWDVEEGEELSPVGPLLAASGEYAEQREDGDPWMGYRYRIVLSQGGSAPGGAYDYVINGNMIAGFAFLAYPAQYRSSGVMTFMVSHQGKVYEADLGDDTVKIAAALTAFDPDDSWELTTDE
jgi:DUF2950 family protein